MSNDEIAGLVQYRQHLKKQRDRLLAGVTAIREDIKKVNDLIDKKLAIQQAREARKNNEKE